MLEKQIYQITKKLGIGAQFGGSYFCHDLRVIRLPRHGASCPIGIGLSCSADRNIKAKITQKGVYLEKLETQPEKFLDNTNNKAFKNPVKIELNKGIEFIKKELTKHQVGTRLSLCGKMIVARDIAHSLFIKKLKKNEPIANYLKDYIIFYAGPAKTPTGHTCGSLGPTTASRMDSYIPPLQKEGASLVTLAKGNRSEKVVESCKQNGGFYLGTIGGAAALFGSSCIKKIETIDYPQLGMEAVYLIEVINLPAFIIIDDKGNNFYNL